MDEKNFISRREHETFAELMASENERIKEENTRQNRRISELEAANQQINALALSVERLASSVENMAREQLKTMKSIEKQGERIGALENRDGEKWRTAAGYALTVVIGGVIGFILRNIGM